MVLVDTSVWIEVFRKGSDFDLEAVVPFDEVVTCLPVIQEVLQGFRDEQAYRRARDAMLALPCLECPLDLGVFEAAVVLYRTARRRGVTIRSSVDCVIAAAALRNDVMVLHRDRDYPAIAEISDLQQRSV